MKLHKIVRIGQIARLVDKWNGMIYCLESKLRVYTPPKKSLYPQIIWEAWLLRAVFCIGKFPACSFDLYSLVRSWTGTKEDGELSER